MTVAPLAVGDFVLRTDQQAEPWGHPKGRILTVDGNPGNVLVATLAPSRGREWWPVGPLAVLPPDPTDGPWPPLDNDCDGRS